MDIDYDSGLWELCIGDRHLRTCPGHDIIYHTLILYTLILLAPPIGNVHYGLKLSFYFAYLIYLDDCKIHTSPCCDMYVVL